jgi:hypothetical protein
MGFMIGFGLFPGSRPQAGGAASNAHGVTLAAAPAARTFFDSGAARGADAADTPLSGITTAPAGSQIEARLVRADTLAEVHPWQVIATAAGGAWAGRVVGARRHSADLKAEVRVVEATDAARALGSANGGITTAMSHLAATLIANAPNERFLFIDAARSGTNRVEISDDHGPGTDTDRNWQASLKGAVHIIRAWGGDVGVVMDTWTAADSQNATTSG